MAQLKAWCRGALHKGQHGMAQHSMSGMGMDAASRSATRPGPTFVGVCELQGLEEARAQVVAELEARCSAAVAARQPLVRLSSKAAEVRLFNPRFEEDYVASKDYDPDRCATSQPTSRHSGANVSFRAECFR
jgi:hypothetical protein